MNIRKTLIPSIGLLLFLPFAARADHITIQGRTGLPTVREGKDKIWIEGGTVEMKPNGDELQVIQNFTLRYPGEPLERKPLVAKIAVREDYYRARDKHAPVVTDVEAKGFTDFAVAVDDAAVSTTTDSWRVNDKRDTATRWRVWEVRFEPGQARKMQVISRAPLGEKENRNYAEFVAKDIGHWRHAPESLVIRYIPPPTSGVKAVALAPKPDNGSGDTFEWVYKKASPNRDVFVLMPPSKIDRRN